APLAAHVPVVLPVEGLQRLLLSAQSHVHTDARRGPPHPRRIRRHIPDAFVVLTLRSSTPVTAKFDAGADAFYGFGGSVVALPSLTNRRNNIDETSRFEAAYRSGEPDVDRACNGPWAGSRPGLSCGHGTGSGHVAGKPCSVRQSLADGRPDPQPFSSGQA